MFTPPALKFLRGCFNQKQYPTKSQKIEIAERVRQIPGNEHANFERVSAYFNNKRSQSRKSSGQEHPTEVDDTEAMLFPSLPLEVRLKLHQLYRLKPDPNDDLVAFWAERLDSDLREVADWVRWKGMQERASPAAHLPTPATSTSPPTRYASLPPIEVKQESSADSPVYPLSPAHTPVAPRPASRRGPPAVHTSGSVERLGTTQPMSRKSALLPPKTEQSPAPQVAAVPVPPRPRVPDPVNRPAVSLTQSVECRIPRTIEEFNSMSEPVMATLQRFIDSARSQTLSQN